VGYLSTLFQAWKQRRADRLWAENPVTITEMKKRAWKMPRHQAGEWDPNTRKQLCSRCGVVLRRERPIPRIDIWTPISALDLAPYPVGATVEVGHGYQAQAFGVEPDCTARSDNRGGYVVGSA
jgi:hypothetical protein